MKKLLNRIKNKKGFTLAELLIVVAIIAVLVAIAIPIFNTQLEKSRDATSVANMRAAYAEASAALLDGTSDNSNVKIAEDGKSVSVEKVAIKSHSANGWSDQAGDLPFKAPEDTGANKDMTITFTVDSTGGISTTTAATLN